MMKEKSPPLENLRELIPESIFWSIIEFIDSESSDSADGTEDPTRRSKRHMFHEFQDFPLNKTFNVKNVIYKMLIQNTFLFVNDNLRE